MRVRKGKRQWFAVISAALIAASVYLVLDMDVPFKGPIQISDQPIRRALTEMQAP